MPSLLVMCCCHSKGFGLGLGGFWGLGIGSGGFQVCRVGAWDPDEGVYGGRWGGTASTASTSSLPGLRIHSKLTIIVGYDVQRSQLPLWHCVSPVCAGASSFLEHKAWFGSLSAIGLVTSFSSTLMFTALGSFFNRISDPGER